MPSVLEAVVTLVLASARRASAPVTENVFEGRVAYGSFDLALAQGHSVLIDAGNTAFSLGEGVLLNPGEGVALYTRDTNVGGTVDYNLTLAVTEYYF